MKNDQSTQQTIAESPPAENENKYQNFPPGLAAFARECESMGAPGAVKLNDLKPNIGAMPVGVTKFAAEL